MPWYLLYLLFLKSIDHEEWYTTLHDFMSVLKMFMVKKLINGYLMKEENKWGNWTAYVRQVRTVAENRYRL